MASDSGSFFVDANVLVYAAVQGDPRHKACRVLLQVASAGSLHISPQIVTEFYSTITSPKRVTDPYSPRDAVNFIEILLAHIHVFVLPISRDVPRRLFTLLKTSPVRGPHVFDLQIVATMLAHGVTKLCTYNGADFRQFTDLELFEPTHAGALPEV
jgi:predicted nucleic acid-binding protein